MYVHGFHPVRERLRHRPGDIVRVLVSARAGGRRSEIEGLCRRQGVACRTYDVGELDRLAAGEVHNGFVAEVTSAAQPTGGGDPELVVVLEDVQDPRNLGAILRVCEGAGVGKVYIRDRGSAGFTPIVAKASAGAIEWLEVERVTNAPRLVQSLQSDGYWVYGTDMAGEPAWSTDLKGKCALCFGGEGSGLRELTRKRCDGLISLPMKGRVESLNIATAASAVLYEALRQRST